MTSKTKFQQSENPKFERYVPPDVLELYNQLFGTYAWTEAKEYNKWFRENKPNFPRSSVTRWTRAFIAGQAHTETPKWHRKYRDEVGIVPAHFSALRDGRYHAEREKWAKEGWIRYVNWGDWHKPFGDGAMITLAMQIVKEFNPNIVPMMTDFLDNNLFSVHAPKIANRDMVVDEDEYRPNRNKYREFDNMVKECTDLVRSVVSPECTLINLFGNHELWLLKHLLNIASYSDDEDLVEITIENIFKNMENLGLLWCEMDSRRYLPLTEHFWITHGWKARTGEGATAKAYMNYAKGAVSIASAHTHRQETLWSKSPAGSHFFTVSGTLGSLKRGYNFNDFSGHNFGFQLITHPFEGWKNAEVEDVRIEVRDGFYVAKWRGKEYSERATIQYDPLLDMDILGR